MKKPFIVIDGKRIEPAPPKMKVWRAFLEHTERDFTNDSLDDFLKGQVNLIIVGFGKPEIVNEKSIDENLELSQVVPLTRKLFSWLQAVTFERLAAAPNAVEGKE